MKNSINALICSLFFIISYGCIAQKRANRYVKRNLDAPIISYGDSNTYCRGLYQRDGFVFLGNSDGAVYRYDIIKQKSKLILKIPDINEIRDIGYSGGTIYAMHSGQDGKLIKINASKFSGIDELPEWEGVFMDAIDFHDSVGFLMGDPINGKMSLFHSTNSGETWERCTGAVQVVAGEAGFAASGSNVSVLNDSTYAFITGGMNSSYYSSTDNGQSWNKVTLPYYPGKTIGAYSLCMKGKYGVIVGGDYKEPELKMNTTYYTYNGGETWFNSFNPPQGYRSCVYEKNGVFYACGRTGIDFSTDNGATWKPFALGTYFSMTSIEGKLLATRRLGQFQLFDLIK